MDILVASIAKQILSLFAVGAQFGRLLGHTDVKADTQSLSVFMVLKLGVPLGGFLSRRVASPSRNVLLFFTAAHQLWIRGQVPDAFSSLWWNDAELLIVSN